MKPDSIFTSIYNGWDIEKLVSLVWPFSEMLVQQNEVIKKLRQYVKALGAA